MSTSTVRTKDQLAVLLKLVEVNKTALTRKNMSIRQRIWQVITQKLNEMQGAEKDVEGWKRSYNAWRLNAGKYFEEEKQRIIKDVADDDYFIINVTEEEFTSESGYDDGATYLDPKDHQLTRLHELVSKQRLLFLNSSDDNEPLRRRLWQNIADELNKIPDGVKLPKEEWQKHVDLRLYIVPRGRKRKAIRKVTSKTEVLSKEKHFELSNEDNVKSSVSYENAYEEYIIEDNRTIDKSSIPEQSQQKDSTLNNTMPKNLFVDLCEEEDNTDDIIKLLNEQHTTDVSENFPFDIETVDEGNVFDDFESINDGSEGYGQPKNRRAKSTPIVKSFKFSNRITNTVEEIKNDVVETKEMFKQTTSLLSRMCNIMEERNKKQDETNALLKRNGQLLKILVEYKCGMRGKVKN